MALKRAFLESGGRRPGGFQEELSEVLPDAASAASLNDIARNIPDEEETTEEEEDEFPAVKNPQDEWFKDVRMWVQLPRRSYAEDIDDIVRPLDLDNSNRAALPGQLHRISRIQDLGEEESSGDPISSGVTIRVERVVDGLAQYLQDLLARNESLLIFGVPGVGKTTLLRDLIHLKSEMVVQPYIMMVIDGSAEIGRADVTHPYLGAKTRRILADYQDQASAMMDDIRNRPHTAISDAIQNSKMAAVLGGIQSVTVSDSVAVQEETWTSVLAIQKVRLERRQRCPFRMAVKVLSKAEWLIYHELEEAVDNALQGVPVKVERRWINHDSGILMARWEDPIA
ncbi:hypothetical protein BC832DRAFT_87285 [Gaertneriomyces semiglobifer]|nr:hypothetical protein BC832DRAFT_87285 [Gaertneriomyces semiglobifer]